jgi:hydroxymethylglutaryl-CoA reductase (NADPH)
MTTAAEAPLPSARRREVPRLADDYTAAAARQRMAFLAEAADVAPEHIGRYSFDPAVLAGNIENFVGVAQVPIGIAGPLLVDGEHARGEFYVPLATTEGALVASYNRGMKLLHAAGGVRTTVVADVMQRAPAFGFYSAREARAFGAWVAANFPAIKAEAEATTRVGRLHDIEQFAASRFLFLRFNYTTGDAAGQNLTGKATLRACAWIRDRYPGVQEFYLEANLATDKKNSQVNVLRTRGKRVVAEATIPADLVRRMMHTTPGQMFQARQVSNLGGLLAGVNSNSNHSANAIAALFAATGQDIANVAESSAALIHTELRNDGSYYYSVTIPALIVATYGGGTGLPTQRECLELLGCYGPGRVRKLAEITAATVLCGEVSLGAAVVADEWVPAHERLGRNRT